ncbi:MAG: FAD-dependent thymidylate synthase, partial [Candidatus Krumholzibacteria bacterium]|nr:FAD-dependent thymidylate synthase [Candidatus Krumholzibacteria bacterium]
ELARYHPEAAQYVLTNGHRRRMLVKVNARELYHISRLREDIHAQWDIRQVASDMVELAREKAPITLLLAFGKDVFEEKKKEIFGT